MKSESGNRVVTPDRRFISWSEIARWLVLLAAPLWLARGYFEPRLIGTGDALWYHHLLADAVTQFRAGVFPVYVGQSDYSFNGSVYPLRAAPYYQYFAGLIDLVTRHTLGFFALEHLTAIASLVAGAFTAYGALVWISPTQRWPAMILALLYVMCPGVVGLFYAQDLYMSGMALPWVPLAFAATVRTFDDNSMRPQAILAASLAALWWAHSPIALWTTFFCAVGQLVRIFRQGSGGGARAGVSALIFFVLAAYPLVSVILLSTPGEAIVPYIMDRELLLRIVRDSFPSSLQPINLGSPNLTHLQLGYALWLVLLGSGFAWLWRRPRTVTVLLAASGLLILLLFPVPWIGRALWLNFPETVVGMTLYWPMQRFYIIIAAIAIVCAQRLLGEFSVGSTKMRGWVLGALVVAAVWSGLEAEKLIRIAQLQSDTVLDSRRWSRLENVAVQRHTYGLFPRRPAYFSHGVVEPRMEVRLLDPASGRIVASNYDVGGANPRWEDFQGKVDVNPGILDLDPPLTLVPGGQYLLTFNFARPDSTGLLQISGAEFFREYNLPSSGETRSFGSAPLSEKSITLWTTTPGPETVSLRFIPTAEHSKPGDYIPFAKYRLSRIDERALPVRVSSLIPFRAVVRSPQPALLESPRMFVPGYAATVNGAPVPVRKSKEGLVELSVPQGESRVELWFAGPFALKAAFWTSAAGWVLATFWWFLSLIQGFRRIHANHSPSG